MAGAEDHYILVHELPDQIATLTHVRSLTARLFTRAEQAQNHVSSGQYGPGVSRHNRLDGEFRHD